MTRSAPKPGGLWWLGEGEKLEPVVAPRRSKIDRAPREEEFLRLVAESSKIIKLDTAAFGMMMADAGCAILTTSRTHVDPKRAASEFVRWWVGLSAHAPAWLDFNVWYWRRLPKWIFE